MPKTHGLEQYLEAIYVLDAEGEVVFPSILADYLGVSRPTVTQTIQRMTAADLVYMNDSKDIHLTPVGQERAEHTVRRHRLLERWLTDELGLDWADAHVEAARLEHAVSPLVEARLFERLGHPTTCPHGNFIPGATDGQTPGIPLTNVIGPNDVEVVRIVELAEEDLNLLRFLHKTGIVPGAAIRVLPSQTEYEAGVQIAVQGKQLSLESRVASRVLVTTENLPQA